MIEVPLPRAAAWAPHGDGSRDWLIERDALAAGWLVRRASEEKSGLVVQVASHAADVRRGDTVVATVARAGSVATYKSPVAAGATFVPNPGIRLLATAMSTADGFSLVASETRTLPLHGWAMTVGAVDLSTGAVTEDTRTPEQVKTLKDLVAMLYNGWAHKEVGRVASARFMPRLAESGMSYAVFVGSMIAMAPLELESNADIAEMKRALPTQWAAESRALVRDLTLSGGTR